MKNLLCGVGAIALALMPTAALAQTDRFAGYSDTVQGPCRRWSVVTPSDTADLTELPKALYVGSGGNIVMIGVDAPAGAAGVTWSNVPSSSILPVRPRRVLATGTTATLILGCY